jgi:hypothetical protein
MSVQNITDFLIDNLTVAQDVEKDVTHMQKLFINLQDQFGLENTERDALQHFYGSDYLSEKHGYLTSLLAGAWHEVEGISEGHTLSGVAADVLNNFKGLQSNISSTEMISLLEKLSDDKINDDDYQKLEEYIGLGLNITTPVPEENKDYYAR